MKRILSSAILFFWGVAAALMTYCAYAAMLYGCPLPRWWPAGVWGVFIIPGAVGILYGIVRVARWAARPVRYGVIPPEVIVRALTR